MFRNKTRTMFHSFVLAVVLPASVLVLIFIGTLVLGISYALSTNRALLYILIAFFVVMGFGYALLSILIVKGLYSAYYEGLYETTLNNLEALGYNRMNLKKYPKVYIEEFDTLNEAVDKTIGRFEGGLLITENPDYEKIELIYDDKEKRLVNYDSFKKHLGNIIFLSQSYRNVLIDGSFDIDEEDMKEENVTRLYDVCEKLLSEYPNRLYSFRENKTSLLIYLPAIDSFARIKEQLEMIIREASLAIKEMKGATNVPIHFSLVSYPYSDVEDLLSDLRYARRQGKIINFYLPDRIKYNNDTNKNVLTNSMNINYMSKILGKFNSLKYELKQEDHNKTVLSEILNEMREFLNIDEAGIVLYDEITKTYPHFIHLHDEDTYLKDNLEAGFVKTIESTLDNDSSYYFSKRSHATNDIGRYLDLNDIYSGYFFVGTKLENVNVLIYLIKRNKKEFVIDSYLRECLCQMSSAIDHYFRELDYIRDVELYRSESEYILSMSKYSLYKVDDEYKITYFSHDLTKDFPNIQLGEVCHKVFFNRDNPCHDCPLRSYKKRTFKHNNQTIQVSASLNDRRSLERSLLMEYVDEKEVTGDLYNADLLINSYIALQNNIANSYLINGRGYLLLLNFDNMDYYLSTRGSEGALFAFRAFIKKVKDKLNTQEIYYFNPSCIGILLHSVGHVDVINICESLYEIASGHYVGDDPNECIHLTYLPIAWPRGYATEGDFMRHVVDFYHHGDYEKNKDFIYFADQSIARSASKRVFMLAVIEQEFSGGSFSSVSLQPIVVAKDKRIFGAEILLRINNVYSNAVFNAEEISRIAEQEGKTSLITENLISFIGNMYKEYGNSVFKINNFARIAINIDSTYLKDTSLTKGIISMNKVFQFPKGFLSFEIPEEIIPNYSNEIQTLIRDLAVANLNLSVDRYTGKYVSLDRLKELGFNEIKMTRDLVGKIDTDSVRFNEVSDIVKHAKELGIRTACVGVENSAQFTMLRDLDENMMMQGFHFYKPLSRSDFISALISHNR